MSGVDLDSLAGLRARVSALKPWTRAVLCVLSVLGGGAILAYGLLADVASAREQLRTELQTHGLSGARLDDGVLAVSVVPRTRVAASMGAFAGTSHLSGHERAPRMLPFYARARELPPSEADAPGQAPRGHERTETLPSALRTPMQPISARHPSAQPTAQPLALAQPRRHAATTHCGANDDCAPTDDCAANDDCAERASTVPALAQMLRESKHYKVRARAAVSLGQSDPQHGAESRKEARRVLSEALRDSHPAVRSVAARALGRLGDRAALASLVSARDDAQPEVRRAVAKSMAQLHAEGPRSGPSLGARYYVMVGEPGSRAQNLDPALLAGTRRVIREQLGAIPGVRLGPSADGRTLSIDGLAERSLRGYWVEPTVVKLERDADGVLRARISLLVNTYPGRALRAMVQGAATLPAGATESQVIVKAARSAARRLHQAFTRAQP